MKNRNAVRSITLLVTAVLVTQFAAAEKLPSDERIQTGTLKNGVKWMYRQHDLPPGKMALMIHVDTGSLNETEEQRGLAHFTEHMSFNGSENFPPGDLVPYFESIGMQFGPDLNAFTSFDQTSYMLFLPDTETETVDKGLMVLSDYAFRLLLLDEEIEKERGVILSELRAGLGPNQRLRDKFFERVFAGMHISERLPIGLEKVIKGATRSVFEDYYRTWYRPENVTLMVVGDAAPEPYLPQIEKWFGQYQAPVPSQPQKGPEFKLFAQERAFIITDPEHAKGNVDFYNIEPGRPAITTVAQARVELIEQLGSWIIERRFSERIKKGEASYRSAGANLMDLFHDGVLVNAEATGEPQDWEKMLEELIIEVNRAREHGFLEPELELAKKEFLANAERAVETEPTRNARGMIFEMTFSVNSGEPIMSAQQELDLLKKQLPTVTLGVVNKAFAAHFKPGTFAYVLTMPEKEDVKLPSEEEVLAAAKAAQARKTKALVWEDRPTELLEKEPTPGKVVESVTDEDLAISSAWLGNGVRVHHRFMDYKKDTVLLSITLAGGQIEETAENAGVTTVASLALQQPATNRLKSTDIQDILTGKKIRVRGGGQGDAFTVTVSGSPKDLEIGLQLAHALLTDGKIEQSAFDNWKENALQGYEAAHKDPRAVAFDAFLRTLSGNDPRLSYLVLMPPEIIEAQSIARSQAWFDRLCREAPLEVAVVGEITLAEALPLVEKYIGSLPQRTRGAAQLDKLRELQRGPGPYERQVQVDTITPIDMVVYGFIGCEAKDIHDTRALNLAALTLDSRLIKRIREELGLVYSIGAQSVPSQTYHDAGFFFSGTPSQEPGKGAEVAREIQAIFTAFAEAGPTAEELANAKKQKANELDTQLKEPHFWFRQLQHLDLHAIKLEDLKNINEAYQALTVEQVKQAFHKYHLPTRVFRIIAEPKPAPVESEAEEEVVEQVPGKP
ncbi:MAG: insulinase family protein [Phycisphaerae bacterium]|nr:insulinase family protein [Phycisphaerae bacterium]